MTLLESALEYHSKGLSVIPLQVQGKRPLVSWEPFQRHQADRSLINSWWSAWPDANVGIVTGEVSNIVVIDVDNCEAIVQMRWFLPVDKPYVEWIPTVSTGKGMHLYFKYPNYHVGNRAGLLKDVDVRGQGGCVVAPPSIHPNGHKYEWISSCGFDFPEIPKPLGDLLNTGEGNKTTRSSVEYEVLVESNTEPGKMYKVRLMSSGNWTCNHRWWRPGTECVHIREAKVRKEVNKVH